MYLLVLIMNARWPVNGHRHYKLISCL